MPVSLRPSARSTLVFLVFGLVLFLTHGPVLSLPYFWDEAGQFVPTALDLWRDGAWVAHSTLPNVHPPGVEAFLAVCYSLFGYSIFITRCAMLALAATGLWLTWLLARELTANLPGAHPWWPPLLLLASPLFFMQSFLAQLDMPAMVLTLAAVAAFLRRRYALCAALCVLLVLVKETSLVTPFVFFLVLLWRREWKISFYFAAPAVALACWLLVLHRATGYWLGNPEFAHYNVGYALHPVRMLLTFARRLYYLFFAEGRFLGTILIVLAAKRPDSPFRGFQWNLVLLTAAANVILVSVLGGAELERYLLPVLPLFYIAVTAALYILRPQMSALSHACLLVLLGANLFWNPPYPFPYENNWAMVDFIRLQQTAAAFAERNFPTATIATAWPYTTDLRHVEFGYVRQPFHTIETNDFNVSSITNIPPQKYNVLMVYTRTWTPANGWLRIPRVREFLQKFYAWEPQIGAGQCARLGLVPAAHWERRGQVLTVYSRRP